MQSRDNPIESTPDAGMIDPVPALRETKPRGWEIAAVLAVGVVPNLVSSITSRQHPAPPLPFWWDSFNLAALGACTAVATLHIMRQGGMPWPRFGLLRPSAGDLAWSPVMLLVAVFAMRIGLLVLPAAGETDQPRFALPNGRIEWLAAPIRYIVAAYAEELVTRVYLIVRLRKVLGSRFKAVVLAAVVFASYHFYQGPHGVASTFIFGLFFGAAFCLRPRIWPLVLGHAAYNTLLDYLDAPNAG